MAISTNGDDQRDVVSVKAVSTVQVTRNGLTAVDGYIPSAGDWVGLVGQTNGQENGVYQVNGPGGGPDGSGDWTLIIPQTWEGFGMVAGGGSNNAGAPFLLKNDLSSPIVPLTTVMVFEKDQVVAAGDPGGAVITLILPAAVQPPSGTSYIGDAETCDPTEANVVAWDTPEPGTVKNLFVRAKNNVPASRQNTFTARKNGADQALSATMAAGTNTCNDTTAGHAFSVAQGDTLTFKDVNSDAAAFAHGGLAIEFVFVPT